VRLGGLGKLKNLIHLIGSQTHDLPACTIELQPLYYHMPQPKTLKYRKDIKIGVNYHLVVSSESAVAKSIRVPEALCS
jgi:hypothetical protein